MNSVFPHPTGVNCLVSAHWADLLTDPGINELSDPQPGGFELLRIAGTVRVHVGTVGGPGDEDGGGQLV